MIEVLTITNEIKDLCRSNPSMTFGEVLYSFLRPMGDESNTGKISHLLNMTNNEIINRITIAKEIEHGE